MEKPRQSLTSIDLLLQKDNNLKLVQKTAVYRHSWPLQEKIKLYVRVCQSQKSICAQGTSLYIVQTNATFQLF